MTAQASQPSPSHHHGARAVLPPPRLPAKSVEIYAAAHPNNNGARQVFGAGVTLLKILHFYAVCCSDFFTFSVSM